MNSGVKFNSILILLDNIFFSEKNTMKPRPIRVLLVHEILLMCNVLAASIEDEEDIFIVACATSTDEAIKILENEDVDIVLTSLRLPDEGALRLTETVSDLDAEVEVVVLGITNNKNAVMEYIEAGAAGYVLKNDSVEDLLNTIRMIHKGNAVVSPKIASALMERLSDLAKMFSSLEQGIVEQAGLTSRELEVLALLGKNLTNQEIADHLVIEVGTVKNHVHNILNKLNVSSREEAAAYLALIHPRT